MNDFGESCVSMNLKWKKEEMKTFPSITKNFLTSSQTKYVLRSVNNTPALQIKWNTKKKYNNLIKSIHINLCSDLYLDVDVIELCTLYIHKLLIMTIKFV